MNSDRNRKNLSLLKNYKVDCDESFWKRIKEALRGTAADPQFKFTHSPVMQILMPSPLEENTKQMHERAKSIVDLIKTPPQSIIEFGGAYGNLCCEYLNLEPNTEYSIVEFEEMLKFTKVFLEKNDKKVDLYNHNETDRVSKKHDLFLSWHAVSEMPVEYQEKIFEEFLPQCKYAIIGDMVEQIPVYREVLTEYYGNCQVLGRLPHHHPGQIMLFAERR